MFRSMLKSKIHRATVTQSDLHYVGSVTVDEDLMDAADLLAGEQVAIVDITNGARLETYVIPGARGTGVLGINGAAAHLVQPGDLVILISYGQMDAAESAAYEPRIVFVDETNRIVHSGADPAHAPAGSGLTNGSTSGPEPAAGPAAPSVPAVPPAPAAPSGAGQASAETVDAARLDALLQAEA